jgi:2-dehydropantoate 2-reductase
VRSVAVLGPGGVGGFLAAALAHAGTPVTVVAREDTAALLAREGLRVESVLLGALHEHPRAVPVLEEPVDVLLVATKAGGLESALGRVHADPALVVPLLNGLDHVERLRGRFGERVAAGTIRIEADRPAPGRIVHTSRFLRVDLAASRAGQRPHLEELAGRLERAGVPARVEDSEMLVLWSKLVRLNALACTTAAADRPLGFIRTTPGWREALEGCVREAVAVARAEGADLDAAVVMAELEDAHETLGSSMQRDIAAGREPELEAIPGAVLRAGARHGLACPTVGRLTVAVARRAGIPPPVPGGRGVPTRALDV